MAETFATTLLRGMFDDASLFPPAAAPLEAVLGLHATSGASPWGLARGVLLLPLGALDRLATERRLLGRTEPLRLGVVVGSPADPTAASPLPDVVAATDRLASADPEIEVVHVEYRPSGSDEAAVAGAADDLRRLADELELTHGYLEVAGTDPAALGALVDVVADAHDDDPRVRAKLRFGGLTPDLFPDDRVVLAFLRACHDRALPWKGTAGLHHAWYDEGVHHGWLSLALAVHALRTGADDAGVLSRLRRGSAADVTVTADGLTTPDDVVDRDAAAGLRASFVGFGTCSFTEPLAAFLDLPGAPPAP